MKPAVEIEKRNVSKARRDKIIAGQGGVCKRAHCDARATDVDHILPLWIGGTNRDDNLEGLCVDHHKAKTSLEARIRGKCNRIVARDTGTRRERRPIPQRPGGGWPAKGSQKIRSGGFGLTKKALRLLARGDDPTVSDSDSMGTEAESRSEQKEQRLSLYREGGE